MTTPRRETRKFVATHVLDSNQPTDIAPTFSSDGVPSEKSLSNGKEIDSLPPRNPEFEKDRIFSQRNQFIRPISRKVESDNEKSSWGVTSESVKISSQRIEIERQSSSQPLNLSGRTIQTKVKIDKKSSSSGTAKMFDETNSTQI